jgi:hypothetical protein
MCEVPANTDGRVVANRPGTVLRGKEKREKACVLIDVAIVGDSNFNLLAPELVF